MTTFLPPRANENEKEEEATSTRKEKSVSDKSEFEKLQLSTLTQLAEVVRCGGLKKQKRENL